MAKITFAPVTNTDTLSTINQNFEDAAAEFQNKVLYRDNPGSETNTFKKDLDMDGNDIFNVTRIDTETLFVDGVDVHHLVGDVGEAVEAAATAVAAAAAAEISANEAAASATNALTQANTALAAATDADASADAAAASASTAASAGAIAGAAAATTQVAALETALNTWTGAGTGAYKVSYRKTPVGVSVAYTVQEKLDTIVQASDFGFKTSNTGAQNRTALQNAVAFAAAVGGGTVEMASGTYQITGQVNVDANNLGMRGAGMDITVLVQTSDITTFKANGATQYQTWSDFTLQHSVAQTTDAFYFNFSRASFFERIKIRDHANGMNFFGFEQIEVKSIHLIAPSAGGIAILCGHAAAPGTNTGANMLMEGVFLRGNDYLTGSNIIAGTYGVVIYDCEAVWMFNTDISNMDQSSMQILPAWRAANHYFVQSFFDGTKNNHNVVFGGTGDKSNFTFTGCWIASAGQATFPSLGGSRFGKTGFYISNTGTYTDHQVVGCRFYNNYGSGVWAEAPNPDFNFSGCSFYSNGADAASAPWRHGFFISPASLQSLGLQITGCRFRGNGGNALRSDGTARNNMVVGCYLEGGVSNDAAATYSVFASNV